MTIPIDIHIDGRRVADVLIPSILSHLETQEQAYVIMDLVEIEPVQLQMTFDYDSLDSDIREQVRDLIGQGHLHLRRTKEEIIAFGKVLHEVKKLLPHGQFRALITAEYCLPDSTITYAMKKASESENANISILPENAIEQPVEPVEEVPEVRINRTTKEEKRKTVEDFFTEFPQLQELSNREIARRCGVDEKLVRTIRKELFPEPEPEPLIESTVEQIEPEQLQEPEPTPEPEPTRTLVESTTHVDNIPIDVDNEPEPVAPNPVVEEEKLEAPVKSPTLTALQSSESNEWYTPIRYINAAKELMGGIDLDPASCEQANELVKAAEFYDISRNGLEEDWPKRVWLNPPYGLTDGESNQALWSKRLIDQYEDGPTTEAVLLVNANIEAKWFQLLYNYPICFVDHRIHFYIPNGDANQPTQGNAFVYFGPEEKYKEFKRIFSKFGYIGRFERDK